MNRSENFQSTVNKNEFVWWTFKFSLINKKIYKGDINDIHHNICTFKFKNKGF